MDIMLKSKESLKSLSEVDASAIDDVKSSLQSQTIFFNPFQKPLEESFGKPKNFEQFLNDSHGNYWFTEKVAEGQNSSHVFIYDQQGLFIKSQIVNGKATLYEYPKWIIAACEGPDNKGYIYKYSKDDQQLIEQWVLDGFLWDIEMDEEALYITSYLPTTNEAVLYHIKGKSLTPKVLGTGFFPTGIIKQDKLLYVSTSPLFTSCKGGMMKLDMKGELLDRFDVDVSPRQIFSHEDGLVLHGLDMAQGKAETLIYVDPKLGTTGTYSIPKATHIRTQGHHLLLFNQETQSLMYWSHAKKKVIRVVHWPLKKQAYNKREAYMNH